MAETASTHGKAPVPQRDSPPPDTMPLRALEPRNKEADRSLSAASMMSRAYSTDGSLRDSLGSEPYSRHSSASFLSRRSDISSVSSRQSTGSYDRPTMKRRGFSRPEGTDFAASAKQRESVLNLGSIAHLQYYFARTGLLDGKGGQLARKRNPRATLDLSQLDTSFLSPKSGGSDIDSSYASLGSSPDSTAHNVVGGPMVESPIEEEHDGFYSDDYEEPDPSILPPTTSTYKNREKPVARPPTIQALKADLLAELHAAARALTEASTARPEDHPVVAEPSISTPGGSTQSNQGWYEIQGVHILDVMTLAIRAAKVYYTSHDHPDRLDAIKSEKEIRSELLSVMEVLKHMATRNFAGGMRDDEHKVMSAWIQGIRSMLTREEQIEDAENKERASWTWASGDWTGRDIEREIAFLNAMDTEADPLPEHTPLDPTNPVPTPFLRSLQNGLRLVKLHNAAVRKSQRRFGAIPTFHTDTQKPYRRMDNLRYWSKAAELRWEVLLKFDVMGVVYDNNPQAWVDFEQAVWKWSRKVREEITGEIP